jgi:hypothetical protein
VPPLLPYRTIRRDRASSMETALKRVHPERSIEAALRIARGAIVRSAHLSSGALICRMARTPAIRVQPCQVAIRGSGPGLVTGPAPGTARPPTSARLASTCLWNGPFSIRPDRAGNAPVAGCPPTVSAADGHGMILIERRVDPGTRHIVLSRSARALEGSGP